MITGYVFFEVSTGYLNITETRLNKALFRYRGFEKKVLR